MERNQRPKYVTRRENNCFEFLPNVEADEIVTDGRVYDKIRDPPGQKSVYIPPCDTNKEVYRMTTFKQFPTHVPVDAMMLARAGFVYTGYKDRVKCFSCGNSVHDWTVGDDPASMKWHHGNCAMTKGMDSNNEPIQAFNIKKNALQPSAGSSYDSGYSSSGCSSNNSMMKFSTNKHSVGVSDSADIRNLENGVENMNVGNGIPMETRNTSLQQPTNQMKEKLNKDIVFATVPSTRHLNLLNSLDLRNEEERKKSFSDWSTPGVSTSELAKSGFFFLGNLDRTQCFSCAGVLRNWSASDVINNEHRRHFPHCKMMLGCERRNISTEDKPPVEPPSPDSHTQTYLDAIFELDNPVNPHMRNTQSRLETFNRRWPSHRINATVEQIAKAGFFFLGERDRAKCWYCNGGLQNWDPNDEPWTEHAKWFPGCAFVLRQKGVEFVRDLVAKFPNINRPPIRTSRDEFKPGVFEQAKARVYIPPPSGNVLAGEILSNVPSLNLARLMTSDPVQSVVRMGFSKNLVENVMRSRIRDRGSEFESAEELLDAVLEVGDRVEGPPDIVVFEPNGENLKRKENSGATSSGQRPTKIVKTSPGLSDGADEFQSLVNERICKTCYERDANTMVTPCGHLALCDVCSTSAKKCKVCSRKIDSVIKTFRS